MLGLVYFWQMPPWRHFRVQRAWPPRENLTETVDAFCFGEESQVCQLLVDHAATWLLRAKRSERASQVRGIHVSEVYV